MKCLITLASLGSGLEYYDFMVYALLAEFLGKAFFPHLNYLTSLVATYGIFAAGYVARPLGGLVFGWLGDKLGRKTIFSQTLLIMTGATFAMGVAPTYQTLGVGATIWFVGLRLLQGFSYGAEMPVALTFLAEHSSNQNRGTNCSYMISGVTLGSILGTVIMYLLSHLMTDQAMVAWGWRLPFLLGGALGIPSYLLRKGTQEPPCFKAPPRDTKILAPLFTQNWRRLIKSTCLVLFPATLVLFMVSLPSYLTTLGYQSSQSYLGLMLGKLGAALLLPIFGKLSDSYGRRRQMLVATFLGLLGILPLFQLLLGIPNLTKLLIFIGSLQILLAIMSGPYFVILAESFAMPVRCTGVAFCYNLAYSIAGFMPLLFSWLLKVTNNFTALGALLIGVLILTGYGAYTTPRVTDPPFN